MNQKTEVFSGSLFWYDSISCLLFVVRFWIQDLWTDWRRHMKRWLFFFCFCFQWFLTQRHPVNPILLIPWVLSCLALQPRDIRTTFHRDLFPRIRTQPTVPFTRKALDRIMATTFQHPVSYRAYCTPRYTEISFRTPRARSRQRYPWVAAVDRKKSGPPTTMFGDLIELWTTWRRTASLPYSKMYMTRTKSTRVYATLCDSPNRRRIRLIEFHSSELNKNKK